MVDFIASEQTRISFALPLGLGGSCRNFSHFAGQGTAADELGRRRSRRRCVTPGGSGPAPARRLQIATPLQGEETGQGNHLSLTRRRPVA